MADIKKSAGKKVAAKKSSLKNSSDKKSGSSKAKSKPRAAKAKSKKRAKKPKVILSTRKVIVLCACICCFCAAFLTLSIVLNSVPEQETEVLSQKPAQIETAKQNQKSEASSVPSQKSEPEKTLVQETSVQKSIATENQNIAQKSSESASSKKTEPAKSSAQKSTQSQKTVVASSANQKKSAQVASVNSNQKSSSADAKKSSVSSQKSAQTQKSSFKKSEPAKSSAQKTSVQKSNSAQKSESAKSSAQKSAPSQKTAQTQKSSSQKTVAASSANQKKSAQTASKNQKKTEQVATTNQKKSTQIASVNSNQNQNAQEQALKNPRFDIPKAAKNATVVIVIDDAGRSVENVKRYATLPFPLTIAVLPKLPQSRECAQASIKLGKEVILHQPMQSINHKLDPGPGKITVDMSFAEISSILNANLDSLGPGVKGMNNHEGSEVTGDVIRIGAVLDVCKSRGIYFLDSRTTAATKAPQAALERDMKIYEKAGPYIDNDLTREKMLERMYETLRYANNHGHAIVIGHVDKSVNILPDLLSEMYPYMKASGYRFATPSTLR